MATADDKALRDALTRKLEIATTIREAEFELSKLHLAVAKKGGDFQKVLDFVNVACW